MHSAEFSYVFLYRVDEVRAMKTSHFFLDLQASWKNNAGI